MKRLLFSFIVLGITSVLAIGATSAYFSDTVTVENNTFAAGTIELDVQGTSEVQETYTFSNIKPGDIGGWSGLHGSPQWISSRPYWTVTNTGSLPGTLSVSIEVTDKDANGLVIPTANGSLSWAMRIQLRANGAWAREGHLGRNFPTYTRDLNPGESVTIDYAWHLNAAPSDAVGGWNALQGHSTEFDVTFQITTE